MADPTIDVGPEIVTSEVKAIAQNTPPLQEKEVHVVVPEIVAERNGSDPTDEEIETLRHIPGRIPWICFTVAFVELCERFAYYGTTAVRKY